MKIIKTQYTGDARMSLKEKVPVVVEEHVKCKCDCRIKEKDCKRNQIYMKSACKCECTNFDDHNKCLGVKFENSEVNFDTISMHFSLLNSQDDLKIWDSDNCTCRCRDSNQCTTGTYYDENTCRCIGVKWYYFWKKIYFVTKKNPKLNSGYRI